MIEYTWWGGHNPPPENLKTKKQLNEFGLKPVKPVGIIVTRKYNCLLFDIHDGNSVRPAKEISEKQRENLAKARQKAELNRKLRKFYSEDLTYYQHKADSIKQAKKWLKNKEQYLLFDTETTGLNRAEIIELAIVNLSGEVVYHSLFNPISEIEYGATEVHGYRKKDLLNYPLWSAEAININNFRHFNLIAYNADFDCKAIKYTNKLHNTDTLMGADVDCLMLEYACFCGDYSNYWGGYKWQPLNGPHNAIGDCLKMIEIIKEMAREKIHLPFTFYSEIKKNEIIKKLIDEGLIIWE